MTLTEFLLARIAEDETTARAAGNRKWLIEDNMITLWPEAEDDGFMSWPTRSDARHATNWDPTRVLAECEAKRRIVAFHESWPVLVQGPTEFTPGLSANLGDFTFRASQQIAWLTEQEYRRKFGDEPPTAPMLTALAAVYADHPDYDEAWTPTP